MIVGFTGSRAGMTPAQKQKVAQLLAEFSPRWVHHGDCAGADAIFHVLAKAQGALIAIHPGCPRNDYRRANCQGWDELKDIKPFLQRNHYIVDVADMLLAVPGRHVEELRSGTWATVRYARKQGKSIRIVWPDGSVKEEG